MAGAFQRLIARATGAPTTGLRPRLPTLFETASPAAGLDEIQRDTVTSAHPRPRSQSAAAPPSPASAQTTAPNVTISDRPAVKMPPLLKPKTAAKPAAPDAMPSQRDLDQRGPSGPPPAQPDPLLRDTPAPFDGFASPPSSRLPSHPARTTDAPAQTRTAPATAANPPPDPLLQPTNLHDPNHSDPKTAAAAPARASAQSAPAAPEITIHIGQLDVRSAQPQPAPPQRPAPRPPSMPALSDYLRGRGP